MVNYLPKRQFTSRKEELQTEKKIRRVALLLGFLTLLLIGGVIVWGIPLVVNLIGLLGELKNSPHSSVEDTIPPIAPQFAAVPEATNTATINISGSSEPQSKVKIYVNDELLTTTQANTKGEFFVEKVPLQKGENILTALAVDEAGNQSEISEEVKVTYDNVPPELEITQPEGNKTVYEPKIEIKGKTESEEIKVTINGHLALVEKDGHFNYLYELAGGENKIEIVAEDLAGNKTKKELIINYHL